jgi:hypothetical protein
MSLYQQLIDAGLPVKSATETGQVEGLPGVEMTSEQRQLFQDILLAYLNPAEYAIVMRRRGARAAIANIPNWATWDEATALAWGMTNIGTPLADGRANMPVASAFTFAIVRNIFLQIITILDAMWTLQKAQARMLIALRNELYPNMPETVAKK